jgi:drug/metabolite transporter (DMT)-like permease
LFLRDGMPSHRQMFNAIWTGVVMVTFGYGIVYWASCRLSSWIVAVLASTAFLWTYLGECLVLRTLRLRPGTLLLLLAGLAGMPLLAADESMHQHGLSLLAGIGVIVGAMLWSATTIALKRADLPRSIVQRSGIQLFFSGALLLSLSALSGQWPGAYAMSQMLSFQPLMGMSYLIFGSSIIAFTAFNWLLMHDSPSLVASSTYVNPLIAMALGILVVHEHCSGLQLIGAATLLGSVILIWLRQSTAEARPEEPYLVQQLCVENKPAELLR